MRTLLLSAPLLAGLIAPASAQDPTASPPLDLLEPLEWRNLGPANMGGRVTDIAVDPSDRSTWYIATAGGGLWKTDNAGTTWTALFQNQPTVSIGDVAVAPSRPQDVWVGSGEENARNSVSWGDGVYKSSDGGATFRSMGLRETFQIGRIAVHPTDPDVVFVAALGRLWGHNPDRGVFRSTDGGASWEKVLYLDEKTGCIDVRIDPERPEVVYAAMYERMRDRFDTNDPAVRFGEKAGLFRSQDGGDTWEQLTEGLPTCNWGRTGLSLHSGGTLFAVIETERSGWANGDEKIKVNKALGDAYMGVIGGNAEGGGAEMRRITKEGPAEQAGLQKGDVVLTVDGAEIADNRALTALIRKAEGGTEATLGVRRGTERKEVAITWGKRENSGGDNPGGPNSTRLGGQNANVDNQGERAFETGGMFRSDDYGSTWTRINSLTDRPFYYSVIAVDPQDDQTLYSCGVPLYATFDGGKKFEQVHRGIHVDFHALWVDPTDSDHLLVGCDGGLYETFDKTQTWRAHNQFAIGQFYHVSADDQEPYHVYGGLQDNGTWTGPSRSRYSNGITKQDWVTIYSGDGFRAMPDPEDASRVYATSQNGGLGRVDMARQRSGGRVSKPDGVRFNWDTPYFLSPHNSGILWFAGSKVCRSLDRGRNSTALSPELGLTERGTATAFAESPRIAGLLYVGTDDGALWRSRDGGTSWESIHDKVLGLPEPLYVSSIEPSHFEDDRVYVTFEGHRSDEFGTHVYVSEDGGDSWSSLIANLPDEPVHVVREFPGGDTDENLLFLGTEFGAYASLDRGASWMRLGANLPTVAVRDLFVHGRDLDLVAATHGQGIFVLDIAPLAAMTEEVMQDEAWLFDPQPMTHWVTRSRGSSGNTEWRAPNPDPGASFYLYLAERPETAPRIAVHDVRGELLVEVFGEVRAGLQRLQWDGRIPAPPSQNRNARRGRRPRGRPAPAGNYSIRFTHGEDTQIRPLLVRDDPIAAGVSPFDMGPEAQGGSIR